MKIKTLLQRHLNESREVKVSMVLYSHLSDLQELGNDETRDKINFIKFLLDKYMINKEYIDPDAEYKEFKEQHKR